MTSAEAHKTLGITSSTSHSKAELLYQEKCKKLRLQMVPGMPVTTRQKAHAEMALVDKAWQTLQSTRPTNPTTAKPAARRKAPRDTKQKSGNPFWPQTTGQPLADFVSVMPLSKPVVIAVFLLSILISISMVRSCAVRCINAFAKAQAKVSPSLNSDAAPGSVTDRYEPSTPGTTEQEAAPPKDIKAQTIENSADKATSNNTDKNSEQVNRKKTQTYQKEI